MKSHDLATKVYKQGFEIEKDSHESLQVYESCGVRVIHNQN